MPHVPGHREVGSIQADALIAGAVSAVQAGTASAAPGHSLPEIHDKNAKDKKYAWGIALVGGAVGEVFHFEKEVAGWVGYHSEKGVVVGALEAGGAILGNVSALGGGEVEWSSRHGTETAPISIVDFSVHGPLTFGVALVTNPLSLDSVSVVPYVGKEFGYAGADGGVSGTPFIGLAIDASTEWVMPLFHKAWDYVQQQSRQP